MYIQSLSIQNLRCFREARLQLRYPGELNPPETSFPNVNLLLGNNGAGKTTVLKSAALGVLASVISKSGFVPYHLVRRGTDKAVIETELISHEPDRMADIPPGTALNLISEIVRDGDYEELLQKGPFLGTLFVDDSPAWFIVGYGATRRVETGEYSASSEERRRRLRYRRVAGLFEEGVALTPLAAWLPLFQRERPKVHDAALRLINRLLPEELRFHGEMEGESKGLREREYLFEHRGFSVPFGALSDGYQAYVGWVADLAYHLASVAPSKGELWDYPGIVLIDEIDLHLHPEWQRRVIEMVAKALPHMQFIFSTHSPIVAGTLKRGNIFVTEPAPDGSSEVRQLQEHIYGLNADQVLVSSYFNLNTTRAPGFERQMHQLTQRAWDGDEDAAVEMLRQLTGKTARNE
jgi:predicted ATPase